MNFLDLLREDDWNDCFHLAMSVAPSAVPGFKGSIAMPMLEDGPDGHDVREVLAASAGEHFAEPWLAALRIDDGRFIFISARCDVTLGNGLDHWPDDMPEDVQIDVQVAGSLDDLVRLAMTGRERERLGYPPA